MEEESTGEGKRECEGTEAGPDWGKGATAPSGGPCPASFLRVRASHGQEGKCGDILLVSKNEGRISDLSVVLLDSTELCFSTIPVRSECGDLKNSLLCIEISGWTGLFLKLLWLNPE